MLEQQQLIKLNDVTEKNIPRPYLGMSQIGEKCYRKLQFDHYVAYSFEISNRIKRIFKFGHSAEADMIEDLKQIGIEVEGRQQSLIGVAGHWKGHVDGIAGDMLVEFKTHNDKSFKDVVKKKVKESKPTHYAQMIAYMGYLELKKGLYMAYNKNDSSYYIEYVYFDEEYFKELKRKQMEVISAEVLLPRVGSGTPTWFECKFCSASDVCFGKKKILEHCRTCTHVDVLDEGKWNCSLHNKDLTVDEQMQGCDSYSKSEMFR